MNWKKGLFKHVIVGVVSFLLVFLVWQVNSSWDPEMRLWKAFGGASFFLLWFSLFVSPLSRLFRPFGRLVSWRRETGMWFFIIALVHGYLIADGWARWSAWSFLGYQYFPEIDTYLRVEPGFGLANLMGLVALLLGLVLFATSFDKMISLLGVRSWKWLHMFAYVIFYLGALHTLYFAFIHYMPSLHRVMLGGSTEYILNPLRYTYLILILGLIAVQALAFIKTTSNMKKRIVEGQK